MLFLLIAFGFFSSELTVNQIGTVVGFGLVKIVGKGNAKDLTCTIQQMNEVTTIYSTTLSYITTLDIRNILDFHWRTSYNYYD